MVAGSEAVHAGGLSTCGVIFWVVVRLAWHAVPPLLFLWTSIEFGQCVDDVSSLEIVTSSEFSHS